MSLVIIADLHPPKLPTFHVYATYLWALLHFISVFYTPYYSLINQYLLNTYYMLSTLPGTDYKIMNKADMIPGSPEEHRGIKTKIINFQRHRPYGAGDLAQWSLAKHSQGS